MLTKNEFREEYMNDPKLNRIMAEMDELYMSDLELKKDEAVDTAYECYCNRQSN